MQKKKNQIKVRKTRKPVNKVEQKSAFKKALTEIKDAIESKNKLIWTFVYLFRNLMFLVFVFFSTILHYECFTNAIHFVNFLLFFYISFYFINNKKFSQYVSLQEARGYNIRKIHRVFWWSIILIYVFSGWLVSSILWFSAWFLTFNVKNSIESNKI
jgi:hypothetical protein